MNPFKYLIMIPFGWLLLQLYRATGNYGVALILFAILIKVILLPLSIKSKKSMMKMSRLSPRLKALEAKCGDDKQKYQTEMVKLYREEGVSMTGGCLWSLIPMLLLIPLYYVIRQPLTYIMGLSADEIAKIVDIVTSHGIEINTSTYYYQMTLAGHIGEFFTEIKAAVPSAIDMNFNFLGVSLTAMPVFKFWKNGMNWANIGLWLLPWLSGGFNFLQAWLSQKMNNTVATDENGEQDEMAAKMANQSTKSMLIFMPLMSVYIGFVVPAGLSLYWIAQAVFALVQDYVLTKHYRKVYDAEDAIKAQRAAEQAAIEAEKERRREERRAALGNAPDPNTSKKKAKAQEEARLKAEKEAYEAKKRAERGEPDPAEKADDAVVSGDPERPYAMGRAYKPDRYPSPQKTTYQPVSLSTPDEPASDSEDAGV
jgi:YidC/Oxa1 family membrane protein insertase